MARRTAATAKENIAVVSEGAPRRERETAPQGARRDDVARRFHEEWLGYVSPKEGLVFSIPVLVEADCHDHHPPSLQQLLRTLVPEGRLTDLDAMFEQLLGFAGSDFHRGAELPEDLCLAVQEGPQLLRPTLALRRRAGQGSASLSEGTLVPDAKTPAARAGEAYTMLVWSVGRELKLDEAETVTGPWKASPTVKFDRLLRACRVPIGLLSNGESVRLIYAPALGASGSITFSIKAMVHPGAEARHMLAAFKNLLSAQRFFSVAPDRQLPQLLAASRARQADVTTKLAGQVLDALGMLLGGIEAAADRDGGTWLKSVLEREDGRGGHELYEGLLTVLLRLVFLLYAEDNGLLPLADTVYERNYSVHALHQTLQEDEAQHPDTMDRRFGAWPRLLALFRMIHGGLRTPSLAIPARKGDVFDPRRFPFLEGTAGRVPHVDDGTIFRVLGELLVLEGQRLSYRALEVEDIGSVYEAMMGFRVERMPSAGVCLRGNRVWVAAKPLAARAREERATYLEDELGVDKAVVKKLAAGLKDARDEEAVLAALETQAASRRARARRGQLVLQPGPERRRTSSHYTPRTVTEGVVTRALEPLLGAMGEAPSSERLLSLKICDPAMGSGAFLVAACRFVAEQVQAAWVREGNRTQVGNSQEDVLLRAKRLVAQRCLYGVDKNPLAVNLAKLALWLETMAKDEPFTFVDHALRRGDSLVGLDVEQIERLDWVGDANGQLELAFGRELKEALLEARKLREGILELARHPGVRATLEKQQLLQDAEDAIGRVRAVADLVIGAWFAADSDKGRRAALARRQQLALTWLRSGGEMPGEVRTILQVQREEVPTFHWMVEFPEIFFAERPDPLDEGKTTRGAWVDAFVGNPPFAGMGGVIDLHRAYLPWLQRLHPGAHGNADLCAHFFRRAFYLLGEHGTMGFVATNTICQGDTRETGLGPIVANNGVIYDAVKSMPWPGDAAVAVSLVHLAKGHPARVPRLSRRLDGVAVEAINSRLLSGMDRPQPRKLKANDGRCFQGTFILGMGFVLTPEERRDLIRKNPANGKVIFPYLGGEEVNTSPTQAFHRYVINFGDMTLEEAEMWPDLLKIVRERVKPERDRSADNPDGRRRKRNWWQFGRITTALNAALRERSRVFVSSRVTKHLCISAQPCDRVLAETTKVFVFDDHAHFAVLQSRIHEAWARLLSSSMRNDLRYSTSDCFETFPFPGPDRLTSSSPVAVIGQKLYDTRAALMRDRDQGLTTTYNQLKDPACRDREILALRKVHEEMDRAVLAAYGWRDVEVPPFVDPTTPEEIAALSRFKSAVIDRLFALNAQRADEEDKMDGASHDQELAQSPRKPAKKVGPKPVEITSNRRRAKRVA